MEGQSNPLPQVDCNVNHNYTDTNSNDNATINTMASNNKYTPSNCNDSTECTSPPNCPISSNNNNNGDSPPSISQRSTVSAHSRNIINNNSPDNYHANIQDSYNIQFIAENSITRCADHTSLQFIFQWVDLTSIYLMTY